MEPFKVTNQVKKSIAIIEDDRGFREQLVKLVNGESDMHCSADYASAEGALPQVFQKPADIILLDINLSGLSGIGCLRLIRKYLPDVRTIMVTVYEDKEDLFQALKAGDSGYQKTSGADIN